MAELGAEGHSAGGGPGNGRSIRFLVSWRAAISSARARAAMAQSNVEGNAGRAPATASIRGTSDPRALPRSFREFAAYWHEHATGDRAPPLDILEARNAPPVADGGIIFDAEPRAGGGWRVAVRFAGDAFSLFFKRDIVGLTLDELFPPAAAQATTERYAAMMDANRPSYSSRRRSWVLGRRLVWVERIYAPFTDTAGAPAYLAGLSRQAYA
jgi:hypothetical protein